MYRLVIFFGVIVLGFSQGVASAATALLVGGKGIYAELSDEQMATAFGGYFATYDQRVSVPFPGTGDLKYSVQVGADNLYALTYATPGPKTIGGVSEGAPSVIEVLRRLEIDRADQTDGKTPPPESELNVAIYGSPSKQFLGSLRKQTIPETPYDILIVKAEYDAISDFPDKAFNLLAVTNALMGGVQLHVAQSTFDIRNLPTEYTIVTNSAGGTTTTILIPTEVLPILAPMVNRGASAQKIANMDKLLRPIIDSAYKRPEMEVGIPGTLTGPPTTAPAGATAAPAGATAAPATALARVSKPAGATRSGVTRRTLTPAAASSTDLVDRHDSATTAVDGANETGDEPSGGADPEPGIREDKAETATGSPSAQDQQDGSDPTGADADDRPSAKNSDGDDSGDSAPDDKG